MVWGAITELIATRLIPILSRFAVSIGGRISAKGILEAIITIAATLGLTKRDSSGKTKISGISIVNSLSKNAMMLGGYLIFGAWILEEALQAVSMSIYIALRNDELEAAKKALEHYRNLIDIATEYVDSFTEPIPVVGDTFVQYIAASAIQAEVYARVIMKKERGEEVKITPPKSGGVYAFTE